MEGGIRADGFNTKKEFDEAREVIGPEPLVIDLHDKFTGKEPCNSRPR